MWLIGVMVAFAMISFAFPVYLDFLTITATAPALAAALLDVGLSSTFFVVWGVAVNYVPIIAFFLVGTGIYLRRLARSTDERIVLLTSLMLLSFVALFPSTSILAARVQLWYWPTVLLQYCALISLMIVCFTFPNGRYVPAWSQRYGLFAALTITILFPLIGGSSGGPLSTRVEVLLGVELVLLFVSMLYAQIYRYFRVSTPTERQQTKWVVFGIVTSITNIMIYILTIWVVESLNLRALSLVILIVLGAVAIIGTALVPLTIGLSVLRYRLWEVDLIINRTLLYGALTASLTIAYFGAVITIQQLTLLITSVPQTSLAITLATLAIAALFHPLRRYFQSTIDARFRPGDPVPDPPADARQLSITTVAVVDTLDIADNERLSSRETEVLTLIAQGLSNRDIAEKLVITEGTVKRHTTNIYNKLSVSSRTQAVAKARDLQLLR